MSAIASTTADRRAAQAWLVVLAGCVAAMVQWPAWETVPFHLAWVVLAILAAWRITSTRRLLVLIAVCAVSTGVACVHVVHSLSADMKDLSEVPLMAVMLLVVVTQARRRRDSLDEVAALAAREHRRLERERELFRGASHELRTPIIIARGHVELVQLAVSDDDIVADLAIVVEELDRLAGTAERMLLLATADDPSFLRSSEIDIGSLLDRTHERWSVIAPRSWCFGHTSDGTIIADLRRLEVVLDVLIENAVAHTSESDTIAVTARARGDQLCIDVTDSGQGIAETELPHLFDRRSGALAGAFHRTSGTGLGLPSAAEIVRCHGGTLSVRSAHGAGSVFTIELPGYVPTTTFESPMAAAKG